MNAHKYDDFNDRNSAAINARKAALEKFRARPGPEDPAVLERQAERAAIAAAREVRMAEREAARAAEAERLAAEEAARVAEQQAKAAEEAALKAEAKARAVALAAEQKAARDARYAARHARKR
jgi:membrane protein involved in colicin uptake